MLVRSALLAHRHGFSTRQGGVSTGPFASLNLASKWGDDPEAVAENRRRFADAGGFALDRLYTAKQVHGSVVAIVTGDKAAIAALEADALVSSTPNVVLAVGTADCVPIVAHDGHGRAAAIHAGWRGTVANVTGRAIEALVTLGAEPADIVAAIGPSICKRCFEVGPEVAAQFHDAFPKHREIVDDSFERPHVDLRQANVALLRRAGVETIDAEPPCTMCEPDRFFSFRRDGGGIGQHLSFVATT